MDIDIQAIDRTHAELQATLTAMIARAAERDARRLPQDLPGVDQRYVNALARAGVVHLSALTAMSEDELLRITGIGRHGRRQLVRALAQRGLAPEGGGVVTGPDVLVVVAVADWVAMVVWLVCDARRLLRRIDQLLFENCRRVRAGAGK